MRPERIPNRSKNDRDSDISIIFKALDFGNWNRFTQENTDNTAEEAGLASLPQQERPRQKSKVHTELSR